MSGAADLDPEDAKIVTLARSARARTGAAEGAAVRDTDGRTYVAATVALPSLSLTALQAAVAAAVSSGARPRRPGQRDDLGVLGVEISRAGHRPPPACRRRCRRRRLSCVRPGARSDGRRRGRVRITTVLITPVHEDTDVEPRADTPDGPNAALAPSDDHPNGRPAAHTRDDAAGAYAGRREEDDVRRG